MSRALAFAPVVAGAAVAAFLFPAIASSAHAQRVQFVETQMRIGKGPPAFHGKVEADKAVCVPHRKVEMFRQEPGPDALLGTDRSDKRGKWEVRVHHPSSGVYYAKALKVNISQHVLCEERQSRRVVVD